MSHVRRCVVIASMMFAALAIGTANAATVAQMNLEEMVTKAERIFVGTVVDVSESRIAAGGGQLPAVTYRLRVSDTYKGEYEEIKGEKFTEVTMLGSLKTIADGRHPISDFPILSTGEEYLLFVAPAGPVGLTSTMGLAQGFFSLTGAPDDKVALNGVNNVGLFSGMSLGFTDGAAISYGELAALIRQILEGAQ